MRISEAVIHGVKAGAAGIRQPRGLDGRGLVGEGDHAVVRHVHGEIDENVNAVAADLCGKIGVGDAQNIVPIFRHRLHFTCHGVGADDAGIAMDLDLAAVVVLQ